MSYSSSDFFFETPPFSGETALVYVLTNSMQGEKVCGKNQNTYIEIILLGSWKTAHQTDSVSGQCVPEESFWREIRKQGPVPLIRYQPSMHEPFELDRHVFTKS